MDWKDRLEDIDDDYLVGLSNKGIVKRAYKDKEEVAAQIGEVGEEASVKVGEETVTVRFPLGESKCTCPSRSMCRHVVQAILVLRESCMRQQEGAAPEGGPEGQKGAAPEGKSGGQKGSAPEGESDGQKGSAPEGKSGGQEGSAPEGESGGRKEAAPKGEAGSQGSVQETGGRGFIPISAVRGGGCFLRIQSSGREGFPRGNTPAGG